MDEETLEEAAELNAKKVGHYAGYQDFIAGAKWQQERMFELVEEYNQMLIDSNVHEDHKEKII